MFFRNTPDAVQADSGQVLIDFDYIVDPSPYTGYSSSSDDTLTKSSTSYSTAHNATTGTVFGGLIIGQRIVSTTKYIYRGFVFFDTSSIPSNATITSATLSLYGYVDTSGQDFNITIQNGQPTYPHDPLEVGDYLYSQYSGSGGTFDTSGFITGGYNDIALSVDGLSWIQIGAGAQTKLALVSSRDISSLTPSTGEYIQVFATGQQVNGDPRLVVNYTVPDTTPPVPSSISPASASTITDTTQTITFTTDENATCYLSLDGDEAYADMADDTLCTGGGTTSQSCTTPDLGADGSKSVYIACTDGTNADTALTNEGLTYTLDTTPPAPTVTAVGGDTASTWSTSDTSPLITLTLNENGDCYASETDEAYDDMSTDVNCTGDGTTSISCQMGTLAESASKTIYVACQDTPGNKDTIATNEAITMEIDATPPTTSSFSPASGSTTVDSTPTLTFSTNETADCFASADGDETFDQMSDDTDCTVGTSTSHSCTMGDLGVDGAKTIYIACEDDTDASVNKDTIATNDSYTLTLDTAPPVPSSFSPASGSTIDDATPTITFTLSENGDCYASTTDETYDSMSDNTNCTGDGTTSQSCTLADLGADGSKSVYIACQDTPGNKDTAATNENLTYTLSTNAAPSAPTLISPANASYTVDTTPALSVSYSDADANDTGTTNYRISSSSLANCVNNTDIVASGTSSATSTNSENTSYTPTSSIGADATYYWCAQNNDGVLTSSWTQMGSFTLDTANPTTTDNFSNNNVWTSSNQTITLTPADAASGVSWTKYCADTENTCDPASGTSYTVAVTISTEGTSYFRYASQDSAGNTQTTVSKTVKIDATAPVTIISIARNGNSINSTLTCADTSGSGCTYTYYCTDTTDSCAPTTVYSATVNYQITSGTYFRYYSVDALSQTNSIASQPISLQGGSGGAPSSPTPWSQQYETPPQPPPSPPPRRKTTPKKKGPKKTIGKLSGSALI